MGQAKDSRRQYQMHPLTHANANYILTQRFALVDYDTLNGKQRETQSGLRATHARRVRHLNHTGASQTLASGWL